MIRARIFALGGTANANTSSGVNFRMIVSVCERAERVTVIQPRRRRSARRRMVTGDRQEREGKFTRAD